MIRWETCQIGQPTKWDLGRTAAATYIGVTIAPMRLDSVAACIHCLEHWNRLASPEGSYWGMVMREFYLALTAAALSVVLVQRFAVPETQSMSYEGWHGSSDFANGRYIGCHLDSPPATPDL